MFLVDVIGCLSVGRDVIGCEERKSDWCVSIRILLVMIRLI